MVKICGHWQGIWIKSTINKNYELENDKIKPYRLLSMRLIGRALVEQQYTYKTSINNVFIKKTNILNPWIER
jgi:hypothetical protein